MDVSESLCVFFVGFFDKAKKKILGDKPADSDQSGEPARRDELGGLSGYDPSWWEDQELGERDFVNLINLHLYNEIVIT